LIWLCWIRIRIGYADPDPRARKCPKLTNKPDFHPFNNEVPLFFYVKIQLFVTAKSELDPYWFGTLDPDRDPQQCQKNF
jgi:hypothetical protein